MFTSKRVRILASECERLRDECERLRSDYEWLADDCQHESDALALLREDYESLVIDYEDERDAREQAESRALAYVGALGSATRRECEREQTDWLMARGLRVVATTGTSAEDGAR